MGAFEAVVVLAIRSFDTNQHVQPTCQGAVA